MPPNTSLRAVARALPPHYADQATLIGAFQELWAARHFNGSRLEELFRAVQVGGRHLALPIDEYRGLESFRARNDAWTSAATELGARVVEQVLERSGVTARDVDHLYFVTVTGLATPPRVREVVTSQPPRER